MSPNYPEDYGNSQACVISGSGGLVLEEFQTESGWDKLFVNGVAYSGSKDSASDIDEAIMTENIEWSADSSVTASGWKICQQGPTPAPTPAPTWAPTPPIPASGLFGNAQPDHSYPSACDSPPCSCAQLGWGAGRGTSAVCSSGRGPHGQGHCMGAMSMQSADVHCGAMGARLCTEAEIAADELDKSDCPLTTEAVWTSDGCNLADGSPGSRTRPVDVAWLSAGFPAECRGHSEGLAVPICCADATVEGYTPPEASPDTDSGFYYLRLIQRSWTGLVLRGNPGDLYAWNNAYQETPLWKAEPGIGI